MVVVGSEAEKSAFLELMPPERRPFIVAGTPDQVVDTLAGYIEAGFTGFTFNNAIYRTPEQIARVGELLRMVRPVAAR